MKAASDTPPPAVEASGEFDLIARYLAPLAAAEPGALGLLDDAAVLSVPRGESLVVTTDTLVAGVHFLTDEAPAVVAARALAVNLSDLAAMGATPWTYTLSLALPADLGAEQRTAWTAAFAGGLYDQQTRFGATLVGGDTVAAPGPLSITVTALGHVQADKALRRSGAQPGDQVWVSGSIGDGVLGLAVATGRLPDLDVLHAEALATRYRKPAPRVSVGVGLRGLAHAAVDVSDGLVADVGHICETSGVEAVIVADQIPLSQAARTVVATDPSRFLSVLTGGDDYEIAFTASPSAELAVASLATSTDVPLTRIGEIRGTDTARGQVRVVDQQGRDINVPASGYRHF